MGYIEETNEFNKQQADFILQRQKSVLDTILTFFKKVVNRQTETDQGIIYHAGELDIQAEVFINEVHTEPAPDGIYIPTSNNEIIIFGVKNGKVNLRTYSINPEY